MVFNFPPSNLSMLCYAKSLQSCLTLCDPIDGSPPGFPIPGILQARTLEWVAISFSNAWKWKVKVKSLSRVRLLATPGTASPPGSSAHGIFQARVLEWGAIAFSEHYMTVSKTTPFGCYTSALSINTSLSPTALRVITWMGIIIFYTHIYVYVLSGVLVG